MKRRMPPIAALIAGVLLGCWTVAALSASSRAAAPPSPVEASNLPLVTEKMERRVRSVLRQHYKVLVTMDATTQRRTPDGGVQMWGVFSFSVFADCVAKHPDTKEGRKEGRKLCQAKLVDEDLGTRPKCRRFGLVQVTFGKARASNPKYGGKLTLGNHALFDHGCQLDDVGDLSHKDVDGDGKLEILVDLMFTRPTKSFHEQELYKMYSRFQGVFREDLAPQFALRHPPVGAQEVTAGSETAGRARLEDTDGDGRSDVVVETMDYEYGPPCDYDSDQWPQPDGEACVGDIKRHVFRYDKASDTYKGAPIKRGDALGVPTKVIPAPKDE